MFGVRLQAFVLLAMFFGDAKSLLFHNDGYPTPPTPVGPLGLEATVSLLVQEINRMNADMKTQEMEIVDLKMMLGISNSISTSTIHLLDELKTLNSTVSSLRTDLELINHSSGTQIILEKLNNIAQSVRYLTLSQHDQETKVEAINHLLHQGVYELKTNHGVLSLSVASLTSTEKTNIAHLQSQLTTVKSSVTSLQTQTSSLQSHVTSLQYKSSSFKSKSSQLSSNIDTFYNYFRRFLFEGFDNSHLNSAFTYYG